MTSGLASGLDGVVVADTELSHVDGERGDLFIRGLTVRQLAASGRFEAAIALLWGTDESSSAKSLAEARCALSDRIFSSPALSHSDATAGLRSALADMEGASAIDLVAACGLFVAAFCAHAQGRDPRPPDKTLSHADDLVQMIRGSADEARGRALASYLCTVVDHGMNASTFTARVIASTGSDSTSAVTGALGALKGPLHGGAPGPVLDMLDAIGASLRSSAEVHPEGLEREKERIAAWIEAEIAAGRRIMGMGHRIYRVRDPRVEVLEEAIETLMVSRSSAGVHPRGLAREKASTEGSRTRESEHRGGSHARKQAQEGLDREKVSIDRLALARAVEREAEAALQRRKPGRPLKANVEFATAVLLDAIGIPREGFTAMFAAGRVVGWLAHIDEQRRTGRLIRPASRYIGPVPVER